MFDDPGVLSAITPWWYFWAEPRHHGMRWSMCAKEVCFKNELLRYGVWVAAGAQRNCTGQCLNCMIKHLRLTCAGLVTKGSDMAVFVVCTKDTEACVTYPL